MGSEVAGMSMSNGGFFIWGGREKARVGGMEKKNTLGSSCRTEVPLCCQDREAFSKFTRQSPAAHFTTICFRNEALMNETRVDCAASVPLTKRKQPQRRTSALQILCNPNLRAGLEGINVCNTSQLSLARPQRQPAVSWFPFVRKRIFLKQNLSQS